MKNSLKLPVVNGPELQLGPNVVQLKARRCSKHTRSTPGRGQHVVT